MEVAEKVLYPKKIEVFARVKIEIVPLVLHVLIVYLQITLIYFCICLCLFLEIPMVLKHQLVMWTGHSTAWAIRSSWWSNPLWKFREIYDRSTWIFGIYTCHRWDKELATIRAQKPESVKTRKRSEIRKSQSQNPGVYGDDTLSRHNVLQEMKMF